MTEERKQEILKHYETDKSIACCAFGLACHARCEVKVLQAKMEDTRDKHRL